MIIRLSPPHTLALLPLLIGSLTLSQATLACPDLIGTWKSSKEISLQYYDSTPDAIAEVRHFLEQILGRTEITYTDSTIRNHGKEPVEVEIYGQTGILRSEERSANYEMIACDDASVTIRIQDSEFEGTEVKAHFIDENTYWYTDEELPDIREYFLRRR
ncbi:hypothetical protein [Pseudomaricurvus sp. HS19]|uniref:hypothetical protein n=1 Tax=Pseudomaricurvus sp. HS19 TaxID=2692626 RepID=UPI00136F4A89|nr:hypothetical protein [Pseudomaricurvus sp. HS19]MYM63416.1 hypothetical protein [Pseudomaricurvus sp. HS19]